MSTKFYIGVLTIIFPFCMMAQTHTPAQWRFTKDQANQHGWQVNKITPKKALIGGEANVQSHPLSTEQRLIKALHNDGTSPIDSTFFIYNSNERGSYTAPDSFVYYSYWNADSTYIKSRDDNFSTSYPNIAQGFNDHNRIVYTHSYTPTGILYQSTNNKWNSSSTYVTYSNQLTKYQDPSGGYTDYFYYETDWDANGNNLRDSIVQDVRKNDPSLSNNYTRTIAMFFNSGDSRPAGQIQQIKKVDNIEVDTVWVTYIDDSSLAKSRDFYSYNLYDLSGNLIGAYNEQYDYSYNDSGLLDSTLTSVNHSETALQTFTYTDNGQILGTYNFTKANNTWIQTSKQENKYQNDILVEEASYQWVNDSIGFVESFKKSCTLNSDELWDTIRYYNHGQLSSMLVSTFNERNNILRKDAYSYDANNNVVSTFVTEYIYEEYETSSTKDEPSSLAVTLFPNPFSNSFNVKIDDQLVGDTYTFTLTDMYGRLIKQGKINQSTLQISSESLPVGAYTLQVMNGDKSKRFVSKLFKN